MITTGDVNYILGLVKERLRHTIEKIGNTVEQNYAKINGDSNNKFKVAESIEGDDATSREQLFVEGNEVDKLTFVENTDVVYNVTNGTELVELIHSFEGKTFTGHVIVNLADGVYEINREICILGQGESTYQALVLQGSGRDNTVIKRVGEDGLYMFRVRSSFIKILGITLDGDKKLNQIFNIGDSFIFGGSETLPLRMKNSKYEAISAFNTSDTFWNYSNILNCSTAFKASTGVHSIEYATLHVEDSPSGSKSYGIITSDRSTVKAHYSTITSTVTVSNNMIGTHSDSSRIDGNHLHVSGANIENGISVAYMSRFYGDNVVIENNARNAIYVRDMSYCRVVNATVSFTDRGIQAHENSYVDAYSTDLTGGGVQTGYRGFEVTYGSTLQCANSSVSDTKELMYASRGANLMATNMSVNNINDGTNDNYVKCYDGSYIYAIGTPLTSNIPTNEWHINGSIRT